MKHDGYPAGYGAARAETTTDDPHDGDGNRLTPEWQPETTTATTEDAARVLARPAPSRQVEGGTDERGAER